MIDGNKRKKNSVSLLDSSDPKQLPGQKHDDLLSLEVFPLSKSEKPSCLSK